MNDTTASSMSTVVSSQDTSSSSCNSEEKNDLQDFSQTLEMCIRDRNTEVKLTCAEDS